METIELPLSGQTLRNIKVLRQLTGLAPADLTAELAQMIDQAVAMKIIQALGISHMVPQASAPVQTSGYVQRQTHSPAPVMPGSPDDIADGLGDSDAELAESIQSLGSGITDRDLENDMTVEDPNHEAKGMPAFKESPVEHPEALFGLGIPKSPDEEAAAQSAPTQQPRKRRGARVSLAGNAPDA